MNNSTLAKKKIGTKCDVFFWRQRVVGESWDQKWYLLESFDPYLTIVSLRSTHPSGSRTGGIQNRFTLDISQVHLAVSRSRSTRSWKAHQTAMSIGSVSAEGKAPPNFPEMLFISVRNAVQSSSYIVQTTGQNQILYRTIFTFLHDATFDGSIRIQSSAERREDSG